MLMQGRYLVIPEWVHKDENAPGIPDEKLVS
jgi:hypothetical protein